MICKLCGVKKGDFAYCPIHGLFCMNCDKYHDCGKEIMLEQKELEDKNNTVFVVLDNIRLCEDEYITEFSSVYRDETKAKENSDKNSIIIKTVLK